MKNTLSIVLKIIYGIIIISLIAIVIIESNYKAILAIISLVCLVMAIITRKKKALARIFFLSGCSLAIFQAILIKNSNKERFSRQAPNKQFTTEFIVNNSGKIYLNAEINKTSGLFLFDTGADLTSANEKVFKDSSMQMHNYTVTDALGIKQTKRLYKANSFKLGSIKANNLYVYPSDSLEWTHPNGISFGQDSILGTIGNNIIGKYIWDFDLTNKQVTISTNKNYSDSIPDSLAINLKRINNHWEIPVKLNSEARMLILDFGSDSPILISDSLKCLQESTDKGKITIYGNSKGALSHIDSVNQNNYSVKFADVSLGNELFNNVECKENTFVDVFGMPFIWSFERVILNFHTNKIYFLNRTIGNNPYGLKNPETEILYFKKKPKGTSFSKSKDSNEVIYKGYGDWELHLKDNLPVYVIVYDSIRYPNGEIKHGCDTLIL